MTLSRSVTPDNANPTAKDLKNLGQTTASELTPENTNPTTEESIDSGQTMASEMSHDNVVKPDPNEKPSTLRTALLLVSVFLSMFLVAVDRTIISTVDPYTVSNMFHVLTSSGQAIPSISDEFNSLPDVGWYGSVYLLTCCAFQLLFGKVYTFYSVRVTLLTNILLFEVASAICGAAPNSVSFIIGRAVAGVGAAGIFAGTVTLLTPYSVSTANGCP